MEHKVIFHHYKTVEKIQTVNFNEKLATVFIIVFSLFKNYTSLDYEIIPFRA